MICKHITLLIVFSLVFDFSGFTNGLKCRLENDMKTQEDFEQIVKNCMDADSSDSNNRNRNNNRYNNNNRQWNNRGNQNNRGKYNQNDDDRDDDRQGNNRRRNNGGRRKQQGSYNSKDSGERDYDYENDNKWSSQDSSSSGGSNRRQPTRKSNGQTYSSFGSNRRDQKDDNNRYSGDSFNKFFNTSRGSANANIGSPLENIDACVIHCVFRQMKMVSDDSYLSRNTVLNVLIRRVKEQELKAFVQESVNECFENLDEDEEEICDYSKSFAMCIEEKGKTNCDDWNLTSKFGNNNRNKNNNKNNGYTTFQNSRG